MSFKTVSKFGFSYSEIRSLLYNIMIIDEDFNYNLFNYMIEDCENYIFSGCVIIHKENIIRILNIIIEGKYNMDNFSFFYIKENIKSNKDCTLGLHKYGVIGIRKVSSTELVLSAVLCGSEDRFNKKVGLNKLRGRIIQGERVLTITYSNIRRYSIRNLLKDLKLRARKNCDLDIYEDILNESMKRIMESS